MDDVTRAQGSIGATPVRGRGRPARTYRSGRVCAFPECATRLSIYNGGTFCAGHADCRGRSALWPSDVPEARIA